MRRITFALTVSLAVLSILVLCGQTTAQAQGTYADYMAINEASREQAVALPGDLGYQLAPVPALVNGGFESADFTGWVQGNNGIAAFCPAEVVTSTSATTVLCWTWTDPATPTEGTYEAFLAFDGSAGHTAWLYQDIEVPRCGTVQVSDRIQYDGFGIPSTLPREYEIQVRATDNTILEVLHHQEENLNGKPETDLGWQTRTFDLAAYGLQTVRIYLEVFIPETSTGPGTIVFDDLKIVDCAPSYNPATGILSIPWVDIMGTAKSYEVQLEKQPGVFSFDLLLPVTRR